MAKVELHEAFFWVCDGCGADQFARDVVVDPQSDAIPENLKAEVAVMQSEAIGLGCEVGGAYIMRPNAVRCSECGAAFDVEA